MRSHTLHKTSAVTLLVVLLLCYGCQHKALPQASGTPIASSQSSGDGSSDVMEELTDPRVEKTLALRSVQMELQATFPGEAVNRILVSIDATGNQRIEMKTPEIKESTVTQESPDWNVGETFVVDGMAYTRMGKVGRAEADSSENNMLREILYDPTGPGMWLILQPEDNFTASGKESKGGFDAVKYTVNGSFGMGEVKGAFWVDEQTGALVGAELSLSESIFRQVESGTGGWVTIDFMVEKADVPPITVP